MTSMTNAANPMDYASAPSLTATNRRAAVALGFVTFLTMLPVTMLVAPLREIIAVRYAAGSFWTHSFMSINMLGAIAAAPLIGALCDGARLRTRIAAVALAADAICLAAMAVMPTLATVLAVRFVEGAVHILALSTLMALAAAWSSDGRRGRMMGIIGACMMFGTAAGTRLGGAVWQLAPQWIFFVAAGGSIFTASCVLLFVRETPRTAVRRTRLRDTTRLLRQHPQLIIPMAYALIDRLCVGVVITTFVLFLGDVRGLAPGDISKILLMFLLPFAVLVYPAGRLVDRIGRIWPIALGSIAFGLVFATYGLVPTAHLEAVMLASGVLSALMFAPNLALCADLAPPGQRGAVFAGFNAAGSLGFVLGPLLAGAVFTICSARTSTTTAYQVTFVVAGATEVLCAAVTLPLLLSLRRKRRCSTAAPGCVLKSV